MVTILEEGLGVILAKEDGEVYLISEGSLDILQGSFELYRRVASPAQIKMFKVNLETLSSIREDSVLLNNMFGEKF